MTGIPALSNILLVSHMTNRAISPIIASKSTPPSQVTQRKRTAAGIAKRVRRVSSVMIHLRRYRLPDRPAAPGSHRETPLWPPVHPFRTPSVHRGRPSTSRRDSGCRRRLFLKVHSRYIPDGQGSYVCVVFRPLCPAPLHRHSSQL